MDSGSDIQHYYHANASAWGGRLDWPIDTTLPVLAPTSLPSVGGYLRAEHTDFRVGNMISIDRAYTEVSGTQNPYDKSFDTVVTATIEGLNIIGVLKAKKITMQIATNHPPTTADKPFPTVSFKETNYDGLSVNGYVIEPQLDLSAFVTNGHPQESWLYNSNLRQFAYNQSKELAAQAKSVAGKGMPVFDRLFNRHSAKNGPNSQKALDVRGNIICTVVKTITIPSGAGATAVGNTLFIPDFGRVFLGELIVDGSSFNLTMMRVDMGSNATGKGSGPQGSANGTNSGAG
jgi:hypothetical protein